MTERAMQTKPAQETRHSTQHTPRNLTLHKETLRRLTPAALRLAAGGAPADYNVWRQNYGASGGC